MNERIAIVMVMATLAFAVVSIVRMALEHMGRSKLLRLQSELYNRLIDKFGSSGEFLSYLQSEAGQQLLRAPAAMTPSAYNRIMNSAQYGAVGVVSGFGILWIGRAFAGREAADVTFVLGWIAVTAGAALTVSAGLSYMLSKKFGLIDGEAQDK